MNNKLYAIECQRTRSEATIYWRFVRCTPHGITDATAEVAKRMFMETTDRNYLALPRGTAMRDVAQLMNSRAHVQITDAYSIQVVTR